MSRRGCFAPVGRDADFLDGPLGGALQPLRRRARPRESWNGAVTKRKEIKVHETNFESPIPLAPEVVLADAEPADLGGAFDACAAALPFVPAGCLRP